MENRIIKTGEKEFLGRNIPVIEGGFGIGQKVILVKTVAEIHDTELKHLNELINRNIKRFSNNDLLDLKVVGANDHNLLEAGFTKMQVSKSKNIYLLSERGYTKLVSMMDNTNEKKWEVMDKLIEEYFTMREIINSDEQLKAMALLKAIESDSVQDRLDGITVYTELKVKEAVKPLNDKIEKDKPKVEFTDTVLKSKDNILVRELAKIISDEVSKIGQNRLYDKLREWGYIMKGKTEPYQSAIDKGYFVVKESKVETPYGVKLTKTTMVTPLGQIKIVEKYRREYENNNK